MDRWGEQLAKSVFRSHLDTRGLRTEWRAGREPPDFYMSLADQSYGIEVTRAMESLRVGRLSLPTQGLRAALERIPKDVRTAAGDSLVGAYVMTLAPIDDLKQRLPALIRAAVDYILSTRSNVSAQRTVIARLPRGRAISIEKIGPSGAYVGAGYTLADPKRPPQMIAELRSIIDERLTHKRYRLQRVRLPRVLLLVDAYSFADTVDWEIAADGLSFDGYHTVARIAGMGRCDILHSTETVWRADV